MREILEFAVVMAVLLLAFMLLTHGPVETADILNQSWHHLIK